MPAKAAWTGSGMISTLQCLFYRGPCTVLFATVSRVWIQQQSEQLSCVIRCLVLFPRQGVVQLVSAGNVCLNVYSALCLCWKRKDQSMCLELKMEAV